MQAKTFFDMELPGISLLMTEFHYKNSAPGALISSHGVDD